MKQTFSRRRYCHWLSAVAVISGGLGVALLAPSAQAQGRAPIHVPGQYIVVLNETVANPGAVAAQMARQNGIGILHVYEAALKGFAATMPEARLRVLMNDPRVKYVERDGMAFAIAQTLPTGINRVEAEISSTVAGNGAGSVDVDVAVIDTGIQSNHPDLNVMGGINYAGGNPRQWSDGHGHGTHVAGTVAAKDNTAGVVGVAPGARLWAVRVLNNNGSGTWSNVIKGIDWVAKNAATIEVANMSLGGGYYKPINDAVNNAVSKGVVFAVAAGNSGDDANYYSPASAASALTVAAMADSDGEPGKLGPATGYGADDTFATFSNYGSVVDIIAPGVNILSTYKGSSYATLSGTSMASPHVAGAAALYLSQNSGATPNEVRNALLGAVTESTWCLYDGVNYPLLTVSPF